MACECGGNRFTAHQVTRSDIVVNDKNDWQENCGRGGGTEVYDAETPYGPYTCLQCEKVWDTLPTYKVKRMKTVEMLVLRLDNTWDTLTMMVPEEEFTKIEQKSEGDSYWYAGMMRSRFTELALKLLNSSDGSIALLDIYHIEDEWQESVIGGETCLI